jgi:NTE family protein
MDGKKVGLALGAGGARGYAHIGVIEVLERHGIPIHCIAGSSIGALVGALYASGIDIKRVGGLACSLKRKHWLDLTVPKSGFVQGNKIQQIIKILTQNKNLEDLEIPLTIVATDIERGEPVHFREGPVHEAVRASISIPGVFVPKWWNGRLLADGAIIDRVPVGVCRDMGADFVIAVDVGIHDQFPPVRSIFDVITQAIDIMERELVKYRLVEADYVIRPDLGQIRSTAFTQAAVCIEAGRQAAEACIGELKRLYRELEPKEEEHRA